MNDLAKHVNQLAAKAMSQGHNVKETVIEEGKRQVKETVYTYKPKRYERTGQLKEDWNWQDSPDGIEIINTRTDEENGKYIPEVIETGKGYDYTGYGYDYEKPRPFIENTVESLDGSSELSHALKKDLEGIGVKVK